MRRPQQERSSATRSKVLDAAVESLLELGYAATTAAVVAERAGVSRGAMQYHFRTKNELLAAAVEYLAEQIGQDLRRAAAQLPTGAAGDRLSAAIDLLWSYHSKPLFAAWLELAVAGRTDSELQALLDPVRHRLARAIERISRDVLGASGDDDEAMGLLADMTLSLLMGLAMARVSGVGPPSVRRAREARVVAAWKATAPTVLHSCAGQPRRGE
ncbi:MAG: TetR/AcrR family transcriptional regulator [Acidimicrobiales bacterium]